MVSTLVVADDGSVALPEAVAKAAGIRPGDTLIIETKEQGRIEIRIASGMTLDEFFERFHIDAPYDEAAIREEAEEAAFQESFGYLFGRQKS